MGSIASLGEERVRVAQPRRRINGLRVCAALSMSEATFVLGLLCPRQSQVVDKLRHTPPTLLSLGGSSR